METNRKHIRVWNFDIEDGRTATTSKCYSNMNSGAEYVSNGAVAGHAARSYAGYGAGTLVRQNEPDSRLAANDDDCSASDRRRRSTCDCSTTNPLLCEMERSDSWKFVAYSRSVRSLAANSSSSSSSSSSSLRSCSEFDQILSSLSGGQGGVEGAAKHERSASFLRATSRPKYAPLRRSFSTGGHESAGALHFRKLRNMHRKYSLSHSILDDVQNRLDPYDPSCCSDDSEFSSGEEYCSRKRRRMGDFENAVESNVSSSLGDDLWNRLASESWSSMAVADSTLPVNPDPPLPGQPSADERPPSPRVHPQPCSWPADVKFQRMRSSSVTLDGERAAPRPPVGSSRVHRSYSDASMAAPPHTQPPSAKRRSSAGSGAQCSAESPRRPPPSWMRASMRLVRPFQLADPPAGGCPAPGPTEAVQIQLPPVFPCDLLERPSSAPVSDRPRQYGRCGRRVREQPASGSSPASPAAVAGVSSVSDRAVAASTLGSRVRSDRVSSDGDRRGCDGDRGNRIGDNGGRGVRVGGVGRASIPWMPRSARRPSRSPASGARPVNVAATHRVVSPRRREAGPSSRPPARAVPATTGVIGGPNFLSWTRPSDVPYPKVWKTVVLKSKSGQTYKVRIEDVTPDRYEEVLDFMFWNFDCQKLISRSIGLSSDPESVAARNVVRRKMLRQKVSLIATLEDDQPNGQNGKIMGTLLLFVVSKKDPPMNFIGEKWTLVLKFFSNYVMKDVDPFQLVNSDIYMDDFGLVVAPEYYGLSLGFHLFSCIPVVCETMNIPGSVNVFTSPFSQSIAEKLGFTLCNEVSYDEYKDGDGVKIFPLEGSTKCMFLKTKYGGN